MLATVGQAQVPDEELVTKLAEVFEQTRKAASAIAVLRPDNTVAQEHVSKASEAAASGDHQEARRHLPGELSGIAGRFPCHEHLRR